MEIMLTKMTKMPGALGRTTEVIIPREQMSWMLDLPDDKLSVAAAHRDQLRTDMNVLSSWSPFSLL